MKRIYSVALAVVLLLSLCACGQKAKEPATWQEQYDLGMRYLNEGNYEQAVLAFEAAIEIDPKQAGAYLALAEIYTEQGDSDKAVEILDKAIAEIGETDELIEAKEALVAQDQNGPRTERIDRNDGSYLIREYDAVGGLVRATFYNADSTVLYEYDTNTLTFYNADGTVRHVDEYGPAGLVVRRTNYSADGTVEGYTSYEHDARENVVRTTDYNANGMAEGYTTYEYDAAGNETKGTKHTVAGDVELYWISEYDAEGYLVRRTYYNDIDTVNNIDEYDTEGNVVRCTIYNADGTVEYVNEY